MTDRNRAVTRPNQFESDRFIRLIKALRLRGMDLRMRSSVASFDRDGSQSDLGIISSSLCRSAVDLVLHEHIARAGMTKADCKVQVVAFVGVNTVADRDLGPVVVPNEA